MKLQKIFAVVSVLLLAACNAGENQTNIELMQGMMDQISVKAQDWDPAAPTDSTNRVPPEGTVPMGHKPYRYVGDPIGAEKNLKNPIQGDISPEVILLGKTKYEIYCLVCHGAGGAGDGPVAEKMPLRPPSLLTEKVRNFSDGRVFHIITDGQGVMGPYASQIPDEDARWAIVNYVRTLQKKGSSN